MNSSDENKSHNIELDFSKAAKSLVVLLPLLVVLGSFYNNGQGSIFGSIYFSSITYQDTLLQLFAPLRTFVFLTTIILLVSMIVVIALFVQFILSTIFTIARYRIKKFQAKVKFTKTNKERIIQEKELLKLADDLAEMDNVSEESLQKIEKSYVILQKLRRLEKHGVDMYDDFVISMKKFLKKSDEPDSDFDFSKWYKSVDKKIFASVVLGVLLISSAIAVIYNYFSTGTVYLSYVFLTVVFLVYILINLINWFYNVESKQGLGVQILGSFILFCLLAIFMYALGRDEAQSAILNSKIYDVYATESIFRGRLIASNQSGVLILEEQNILYIRWRSVQHIELIDDIDDR